MSCPLRPSPLLAAAAAVVLTTALGAATPTAQAVRAAAPDSAPDLRLAGRPGGPVQSATVGLDTRLHPAPSGARTARLSTEPFSMLALTWRGADPGVAVRTRTGGRWSPWRPVDPLADGRASDGRTASDLLWVDDSEGVQVRTARPAPDALDLVLIDPGVRPGDQVTSRTTSTTPRTMLTDSAPKPQLHTRREWGADPSWRNGEPVYLRNLKQVHVHHTATGNGYSRADVPGILRGMYRYHTQTLGWFDLGYNFLVDRFGRAWVGRSGGADRLVQGAHTLGFNHASVGIAVIGNLDARQSSPEAVTTLVKLASWKLDRHGRYADGRVTVTSSGSDKYPEGARVRLPAIDGHRDTNDTACPGLIYDKLPDIRQRAQRRIDRW